MMTENTNRIELDNVIIRFSGDSGDGMQLTGSLFSNLAAYLGNDISTFPDFPAEIRAPQGTLSGVSGFQVHIGSNRVYTPGDKTDVLVAMNPAALKTNAKFLKPASVVIIDTDSFTHKDLEKALFQTNDPFAELGLNSVQIIDAPITSLCKESLADSGLDNKSIVRTKNMFALGLVCWLFNRPLEHLHKLLQHKFSKKEAILKANIKVLTDGYNFGYNTHASVSTYVIEPKVKQEKGFYLDVNGNTAVAYGLIAAAEKAGLELFLGSYPITPATDIMHELAKHKSLGVKVVQAEDEIAGVCTAIGASFAGSLAATSTSGPGLCLKSEGLNLAVMAELPLVVIDVQRGGPSTGLPTKSEQTDLLQALYGRNGESPMPVIAASSPANCFDAAYMAAKIAVEHMTPVVLLTDGYLANGSAPWKIPSLKDYPSITPKRITTDIENWKPYMRDENLVRYWVKPGTPGKQHRIGGLEKDYNTSAISTDPANHQKMVETRQNKINKIADFIPELEVEGDKDADLLVVGWGSTYGHLCEAISQLRNDGNKVALAHFQYINPLPKNTVELLGKYKKIIVCEQNLGQFAGYLRMMIPGIDLKQYNKVEGQPFKVEELLGAIKEMI
jgi:2-oxoglutarate ferredoxin oxidoreductase subunit alpha